MPRRQTAVVRLLTVMPLILYCACMSTSQAQVIAETEELGSASTIAVGNWHKTAWDKTARKWVIKCSFLEGDSRRHQQVMSIAKQWEKHCNVEFRFVSQGGDVKIFFENNRLLPDSLAGNRSNTGDFYTYRGTDRYMRLGNAFSQQRQDYIQRTVLHEFGHVLGLMHEQQNPHRNIEWKLDALVDNMVGWQGLKKSDPKLRSEVRRQIVSTNEGAAFLNTKYDPDSVMHYGYEKFESGEQIFEGDYERIGGAKKISAGDAEMVALLYPFNPDSIYSRAPDVKRFSDFIGIGRLIVNNDYSTGRFKLYVRHADKLTRRFKTYSVDRNFKGALQLDGVPLVVGGDWQLEIEFENGVVSKRRTVSHVAELKSGRWYVNATNIFDGKK